MQLLQFSSEAVGAEEIRQGMSGAPVYHDATGRIVGMVVLLIKETGETIPCAVPIEAIADIWLPVKERLRETELLQQLLKVFQPGEWFTEKTFKSFYESLPSSRLVQYDGLGEDKPQALLEQLRGQGERVYDFVNCIRAKRPDIPLTELIDLPPVQRINFVNRKDELKEACGRYTLPYILFEAPAGYGKTELLKAIEQRHFRDDWLSIYVETSQNTVTAVDLANQVAARAGYSQDLSHLPDTRAVGYTLAGFLDDRLTSLHAPGVILLIDSIERLPEGEIDAFVNHFLFAVHSVLHEVNLRVHLAGRCVGSTWEKQAREFQFTVKPLTPFRFRYVKDTVRSLLPSHEKLDLYAAHLMHVTGGHPGCMAKIIERASVTQSIKEDFEAYLDDHREIVLSVAREIRESIPEHLRDTFDVLSVFRCYNYRLLQRIIDAGLVEYEGNADSLEKELTAIYLVKRKRGLIRDEIVRRLLALRLRWEFPDRFLELCQAARQIYEQDLQRLTTHQPEIAIEGMYQELQLGYYQGKQTPEARQALRDTFLAADGILRRYLDLLTFGRDPLDVPSIRASFRDLLKDAESNWEFRFAVDFFLRGENQYGNEPYEEMLAQVGRFFAQEGDSPHE